MHTNTDKHTNTNTYILGMQGYPDPINPMVSCELKPKPDTIKIWNPNLNLMPLKSETYMEAFKGNNFSDVCGQVKNAEILSNQKKTTIDQLILYFCTTVTCT